MGHNMVCITNNAVFLACSAQGGSSTVRVIMSLMNPSIEDSFALTYTFSVSDDTYGGVSGRYFSSGSICL